MILKMVQGVKERKKKRKKHEEEEKGRERR